MFMNRKKRVLSECANYEKVEGAYNNVLEKYINGEIDAASAATEEAFELNFLIPYELLDMPDVDDFDDESKQTQREAKFYKNRCGKLWRNTPGASDWLYQQMEDHSVRLCKEIQRSIDLLCADLPPDPHLRFERVLQAALRKSIQKGGAK
jgi:hypothetical protein